MGLQEIIIISGVFLTRDPGLLFTTAGGAHVLDVHQ